MNKQPSLLPILKWIVALILVFILGWQLGHKDYQVKWRNYKPEIKVVSQTPPKGVGIDFKLFWETWDLVSKKYIDKGAIDPQKLYFGAIQGMVAAIGDPYTVFLPPEAQKASKEELGGSFQGVGIQLGFNKEKKLVVIAPLKDTPASKAGIKSGDLILKIGERDTTSLTLPEAVNLIRGVKGSAVTLTIFREVDSKPQEVTITRDTIVVKSVEFETKTTPSGKKVGYIRLSRFGEKTKAEWDETVRTALSSEYKVILLDVRNNPGGFLDGAVYVASEFLDGGVVVLQEDARGERQSYKVVRKGKLLNPPLVVLINKGSASASEILAGAIGDRKRGKIVGESSFGKGTIQSAEDLPMGTGIHITTAKWLTPNGNWLHTNGLEPDVKIENGTDTTDDVQLKKTLDYIDKEL